MPSKTRKPLTDEQKAAHRERCRRYAAEFKARVEAGDPLAIEELEAKRARARAHAAMVYQENKKAAEDGDEEAIAWFVRNAESSKRRFSKISRQNKEELNARARERRKRIKLLVESGDEEALAHRERTNQYHRNRNRILRSQILANPRRYTDFKKKQRVRAKNKYEGSVQHRLRVLLRTRIYKALKGERKSKATIELLGCTIDEFKAHIERQFEPWMTWENQGVHIPDGPRVWHIDHIRCLNSFDLSDPKQQEEAMHFSNMRPLEGVLNLKKHAKLNYVI